MALGRVDTPKVEASFWLVEEGEAPSNFREVFPRMAPRTPRSSEIMGLNLSVIYAATLLENSE